MAEAAAVIALVSSITSLVDISVRVVSRVREYGAQAAETPETFRSLADRLPVLIQTLERIQSRAQTGHVKTNVVYELNALVGSIVEQVKLVEQCLGGLIPPASASRLDRTLVAFKSLTKDDKVKRAVEKIHHGIDVLVLHQTTSALEVGDQVLRELRELNLQSSLPPQYTPEQSFGICFGQAPLIDPDAFIGRQAEVQELHEWLWPPQNAELRRVVSIVGMGGLGKTQLSLAYVREHGQQYSSVFWLDAKDEACLRQSISALTSIVFPEDPPAAASVDEENAQVEKVRRWLSEAWNDRWLLIFDNYDDPALPNIPSQTGFDLRQFFPARAHGRMLITTRSSKLGFAKPLKLQRLQDLNMCIAILSQRSGRDLTKDQDSQRLAVRLDGLPLALAAAGTYLAQTNVSCTEYLELYETAWDDLHGADSEELIEYENRTLSSTWMVSFDQVRSHDADAAELLQLFGYLNNNDIWYELIKAGADSGPLWMSRITTSKIRFDRAMSKLVDYSLVEAQSGQYRIHPCLHDWIFEHLNSPLTKSLFIATIVCLNKSILDLGDARYWAMSRRVISHVNRLRHERFGPLWNRNIADQAVFDAGHSFGSLFTRICDFHSAEEMYVRALEGKETVLGSDHQSTLATVNSLGNLYTQQDKLGKAKDTLQRALSGREKVLGPDHTDTLESAHYLGTLYYTQGSLDEAERMFQRALVGREKVLGPDHVDTLSTVNNLGIVYYEQDRLDEAEQMYKRALAGREEVAGFYTTAKLTTVTNLGLLYFRQRRLDEAEQMYQRALAGYEQMSLSLTVRALYTVYNQGLLYQFQIRFEEAKKLFQHAAAGFEKLLGPQHQDTIDAVERLRDIDNFIEQKRIEELATRQEQVDGCETEKDAMSKERDTD